MRVPIAHGSKRGGTGFGGVVIAGALGKAGVVIVTLTVLMGVGPFACDGGGLASRTMTVVGTEMAFDAPESVVAGDYSVTFRNDGAVHHELAFRDSSGEFVARRSIPAG
jgi:hypothetical protein